MSVLSLQVLTLNKTYQPLGLISVKEAIESVFSGRAEIIEQEKNGYFSNYDVHSWLELSNLKKELEEIEDHDIWINFHSPSFLAPRVIRFLEYNKTIIKKVRFSRKNILIRDNLTCAYCNTKFPVEQLQLEHIIPKSKGGKSTWLNTTASCKKCNDYKRDRTPEEAGMTIKRSPYVPKFLPRSNIHFKGKRYKFWEQFVSDLYWNEPLDE